MRLIDVVTAPWAMEPAKYTEMVEIYLTHLRGEKIDIAGLEARLGGPLAGPVKGYDIVDGVAVVPIDGVIAKRMNMLMKVSGGTSLELFSRDFAQAMADPAVHAVVLLTDSPGGSVMGLQEAAAGIFAARGSKPVVALTDGLMASAAYWLASAADAVYISSDMTMVGSIGVIYRHVDRSAADAKAGLKVTEIYAGKYKTMASDAAPLTDAAKEDIQVKVDTMYRLFVDTVARHRGVDAQTVLESMAEGRIFLGKEAVTAGLVDGVSTLDALIRDLKAGTKPAKAMQRFSAAGSASAAQAGLDSGGAPDVAASDAPENSQLTGEGTNMINRDFLNANHADLVAAIRAEGHTGGQEAGRLTGATGERERIQSVFAQAMPGHGELVQRLAFDGKTTGAEAAIQVLAAERSKLGGKNRDLAADAAALAGVTAIPAADPAVSAVAAAKAAQDALPLEDRCKAKWDADAAIRGEFDSYASYLAFEKANAGGRVKILGARKAA